MNDEWFQHVRGRALGWGFGALLATQLLLFVVASFYPLPRAIVARISILVGAVAPSVAVLILDRD